MRLARRLLYIILDGGGGRVFLAVAQPQPGCAFCYVPGSPHDLLPAGGSGMRRRLEVACRTKLRRVMPSERH